MKTNTLLVTCLVLGSSSAAMAGSFSFQARATATAGYRFNAVRDHRTAPPTRLVAYSSERFARPAERAVVLPPLTGPTWDCHNWDPSEDLSSVCAAYSSGRPATMPAATGAGILLGVRDAAIPDHQYITVGAGSAFRKIVVQGNDCAPEIARVAIKFMDGSTQVVTTDARLRVGRSMTIDLDGGYRQINQIVFYTPYGATGSYAVLGR